MFIAAVTPALKKAVASALVVPKIVDYPPYQPTAAREMTAAAIALLKQTIG